MAVARGFGIDDAFGVDSLQQVGEIVHRVKARAGIALASARVAVDETPRTFPPRDGSFVKNRFRAALGFDPF